MKNLKTSIYHERNPTHFLYNYQHTGVYFRFTMPTRRQMKIKALYLITMQFHRASDGLYLCININTIVGQIERQYRTYTRNEIKHNNYIKLQHVYLNSVFIHTKRSFIMQH